MKRLLVSLVALALLLIASADGASSQTKFAVGLRTGLNFATMSFDPVPYSNQSNISQGGRTGFMVGAVAEMEFAKMYAVEANIMYTMAGAKFTRSTDNATDAVNLSEIQIPVLFKVKLLPGNKIRPYGFAGPVIGIVASATDVIDAPGTHEETDLKSNPNGIQVSSLDFALTFGAGAEYLITREFGVLLDLRYALGLSNLATLPAGVQATTTPTWHTRGFMIQVGGLFHI